MRTTFSTLLNLTLLELYCSTLVVLGERFTVKKVSAVTRGQVGPPAQLALTFATKLSNIVAK